MDSIGGACHYLQLWTQVVVITRLQCVVSNLCHTGVLFNSEDLNKQTNKKQRPQQKVMLVGWELIGMRGHGKSKMETNHRVTVSQSAHYTCIKLSSNKLNKNFNFYTTLNFHLTLVGVAIIKETNYKC